MQEQLSEQLISNLFPRTPLHNGLDARITWAPRKNKSGLKDEATFCRRCTVNERSCECSERLQRNPQRRLHFLEEGDQRENCKNDESTPFSCRESLDALTNCSNGKTTLKERSKNLGEYCYLMPHMNSKRRLIYTEVTKN